MAEIEALSRRRVYSPAPPVASHAVRGWRGLGTGHFPGTTPPLRWSPQDNICWKTPLTGPGNSTPVLAGDRLFVTAEPATLTAVRATDGKVLWRRDVRIDDAFSDAQRALTRQQEAECASLKKEYEQESAGLDRLRRQARAEVATSGARARVMEVQERLEKLKKRAALIPECEAPYEGTVGWASATPVSDGVSVFAVFGHFVVVAFSADGELRWARRVPTPDGEVTIGGPGQAASPVLVEGKLIVPLGYLQALNPVDGSLLWTAGRFSDFGTPAIFTIDTQSFIATASGDIIRVADGKTMARVPTPIMYVPPIVEGQTLFFFGNEMVERRRGSGAVAAAYQLPSHAGEPFEVRPLWVRKLPSTEAGTPLVLDDTLLNVGTDGHLITIDRKTGEQRPSPGEMVALPRPVFASLAHAGDRIYGFSENGDGFVFDAHQPFRVLATNQLEPLRASPVFEGSRMFLRSQQHLYCVAEAAR